MQRVIKISSWYDDECLQRQVLQEMVAWWHVAAVHNPSSHHCLFLGFVFLFFGLHFEHVVHHVLLTGTEWPPLLDWKPRCNPQPTPRMQTQTRKSPGELILSGLHASDHRSSASSAQLVQPLFPTSRLTGFTHRSGYSLFLILFSTFNNCDPADRIPRCTVTSILKCPACATGSSCPAWRPSGPLSWSWWSVPGSAPRWLPRSLLSAPGKVSSRPCLMQPTISTCWRRRRAAVSRSRCRRIRIWCMWPMTSFRNFLR